MRGMTDTSPIPRKLTALASGLAGAPSRFVPNATPPPPAQGSVLLVEDDPSVRLSLEAVLGDEFDLRLAGSVREGIAQLRGGLPDVAVSDYQLPDGTGIAFLKQVASLSPVTTQILLTGYADYPEVRDFQKLARTLVLRKPAEPDDLIAWVRNAVAFSRLQTAVGRLQRGA